MTTGSPPMRCTPQSAPSHSKCPEESENVRMPPSFRGKSTKKPCQHVADRACRILSDPQMVEAAGVEPASENDSKEITTCVVSLLFSPPRTPTDKIPGGPVPEDSPITLERESSASLLLMTPVCAVQTPHHTDGLHLCSQSVRVIVVGF